MLRVFLADFGGDESGGRYFFLRSSTAAWWVRLCNLAWKSITFPDPQLDRQIHCPVLRLADQDGFFSGWSGHKPTS